MKFPGYKLAPDESGFSARFIGRSSVARRFIVGRVIASLKPILSVPFNRGDEIVGVP